MKENGLHGFCSAKTKENPTKKPRIRDVWVAAILWSYKHGAHQAQACTMEQQPANMATKIKRGFLY